MSRAHRSASDRAGRATPQAASRLDHAATIPCAAELLELAARCETSREGDMVELIEDAFVLIHPKPGRVWVTDNTGDWTPEYTAYHERSWRFSDLMEAGAFVDAARELLAPHTLWAVGSMEFGPFARLCWPMPGGSYDGGYVESLAPGVAVALCAAALRGHALATAARQGRDVEQARGEAPQSGPEGVTPKGGSS